MGNVRYEHNYAMLASVGRLLMLNELRDGKVIRICNMKMPLVVQYACFHPTRAIAYVLCSNGGVSSEGDQHCLVQVSYTRDTLSLTGAILSLPYRPLHAAVHHFQNRLVIVYGRPAALTLHELGSQGLADERHHMIEGAHLTGHFPHQVIPTPDTQDLLLTCRGDDASPPTPENPGSLRLLRYADGTVTCVQLVAPKEGYGFGPRNCAFHPDGHLLYAVLERQNKLVCFHYHRGRIDAEPIWSIDLLRNPGRVQRPQLGGAITLHPGGQYAYVVNRSHPVSMEPDEMGRCGENSIVIFALDHGCGEPREIKRVKLKGLHARCMALSPDGAFLVAALRQPGRCLDEYGQVQDYAAGFASYKMALDGQLQPCHQDEIEVEHEQLFWADFAQIP